MYTPPLALYQQISPILQEPLEIANIAKLRKQLSDLEALRYEVSYTTAQWHQKLVEERERLRMPRTSEHTEFDRKTMSDASVSAVERDYEFLRSIEEIIKTRIELGITFLQTI